MLTSMDKRLGERYHWVESSPHPLWFLHTEGREFIVFHVDVVQLLNYYKSWFCYTDTHFLWQLHPVAFLSIVLARAINWTLIIVNSWILFLSTPNNLINQIPYDWKWSWLEEQGRNWSSLEVTTEDVSHCSVSAAIICVLSHQLIHRGAFPEYALQEPNHGKSSREKMQ